MQTAQKIQVLTQLGDFFRQFSAEGTQWNSSLSTLQEVGQRFEQAIGLNQHYNNWFTPEQVYFAVASWADALTQENVEKWVTMLPEPQSQGKRVGLVLAGNIPLVGLHDVLCVWLAGHQAVIKLATNDAILIPLIAECLAILSENAVPPIEIVEGRLKNFDAIIATGSNNTARYFEYYFGQKPHIIRKNRNSVAVLNGNETPEQLHALGEDIFRYYGLGCRNVSKLFVPEGYDFKAFFEAIFAYASIIDYEKYGNNYDYNKAVYLMSLFSILDNGFLVLKEDSSYTSPIASLFYETYTDLAQVQQRLVADTDQIQCIVSNQLVEPSLAFGQTQKPNLWDYADGVNTLDFLSAL